MTQRAMDSFVVFRLYLRRGFLHKTAGGSVFMPSISRAKLSQTSRPRHGSGSTPAHPAPTMERDERVRLVVWGWHSVQPGTLSWIFPSARAALAAAHTMKNAVRWAILRGHEMLDLETARARGVVLVEQAG